MKTEKIIAALLCAMFLTQAFGQTPSLTSKNPVANKVSEHKFSVSTPYLTFANFGQEKTNTHHYEFHVGYQLSPKDNIGIKVATWKLFAPMGIQLWDPLFLNEGEFFPGRLRESGIGITYQRMLWKGLFTSVEILPLFKTYLDSDKQKAGNGFKLYTTFHLGYHIPLLKDRFYIEPQIHCNYWPIDTNTPQAFSEKENQWSNYFLFEPNLHLGVHF